ncbi:MAG TPA: tetratricopeptide repeat protein, partial [Tepidisphaeraceae bacterium]
RELELSYEVRFGDPLKAVDTLTQQQQQNPDNPQAAGRLGAALEQVAAARKGDEAKPFLSRAAEVYEKAFAQFPQDLRFLAAYTEIQRRLGQPQVAEQAVEKAAANPIYQDRPEVSQLLADQYVRSGKLNDAARVLSEVIDRTKPAPADSVQRLALILAGQNRLPEALKVLDVRADDAGVQRQRITLLLDAGDIPGARQAAETALATHTDPDTYLLAAFTELRAGNYDRCEGFVNKVLAVRPNDGAALFYRSQVRLNRSPADLDGARDDLIKARDASPRSTDVRLMLADLYGRRGDRDAALTELQQAWAADRSSERVLLRLVDAYARSTPPAWTAVTNVFAEAKANPQLAKDPDVLLAEADTWAKRNDPAKAVATAKAALAVDPKNASLQQGYYEVLMRAKAYRDVVAETGAALQETPDAWWLYRMRGLAYRQLDQRPEAQKAMDAAFNLAGASANVEVIALVARSYAESVDPKSAAAKLEPFAEPMLQVMAAEMIHDTGDLAGSIAKLESLLADRSRLSPPVTRRALQALGLCYMESVPVKAKQARGVFEELLKQTPNDVSLLNNMACMLLLPDSGGTPAEALKHAQRASEVIATMDAPQLVPLVQDTHGWALVKNNRVPEGLDLLRRAADASTFPDVAVHLAEAYLLSGDLNGAEAALVDARSRVEAAKRQRQPIDATLEDRVSRLSDDLAKRKAAAG